jgi:hypothetical protein
MYRQQIICVATVYLNKKFWEALIHLLSLHKSFIWSMVLYNFHRHTHNTYWYTK